MSKQMITNASYLRCLANDGDVKLHEFHVGEVRRIADEVDALEAERDELRKALEEAENFFYLSSLDGAICYRGKDKHPDQVPHLFAYLQKRGKKV